MTVQPARALEFQRTLVECLAEIEKHPRAKAALGISVGVSCFLVADAGGLPFLFVPFSDGPDRMFAASRKRCFQNVEHLVKHKSHDLSGESSIGIKGALRVGDYILSYAGPPGELCEMVVLMVAIRMRLLAKETARTYLHHSQNSYARGREDDLAWE